VRWRRSVTADTLAELEKEAERHFQPGTTYSIYSIREEGPGETRTSYRADAHPAATSGGQRPRPREADGRTRVGRNLGHAVSQPEAPAQPDRPNLQAGHDGAPAPEGAQPSPVGEGPIDGRLAAPGAGPVRGAGPGTGSGPSAGTGAGSSTVPGGSATIPGGSAGVPGHPDGGPVVGFNPETVTRWPGWNPGRIPATALQAGPGLTAAYGLLMDGESAGHPAPGPDGHDAGHDATGTAWQPVSAPGPHVASAGTRGPTAAAGPAMDTASLATVFSTEDPALHGMLDHAAPAAAGDGRPAGEEGAAGAAGSTGDTDPGAPRRTRLVFAGLLDDAIEAAERTGHRQWSAAGVLNGGRAGSPVVCFGLGDGSDVVRLAEGLHRYRPMHLVLAVDTSRKHADTQAWVRQLARVAEPASVLAVPRTVTASPGTVRDLGYPVHQPSDVAARLPW
jgi:hypothetical protein